MSYIKIKDDLNNNNILSNLNNLIDKAEKLFKSEVGEDKNNKNKNKEEKSKHFHHKSKSFSRLYVSNEENKFNVLKKIQSIKHMTRNNGANELNINFKTNIAFNKKNINVVFEPRNQILNYKKRNLNKLTDKNGFVSKFIHENKIIGLENYMIKLLKNESQKLKIKLNEDNMKLENKELKLTKNKEEFFSIIEKQNNSFKEIRDSLHKMYKQINKLEQKELSNKIIEKAYNEQILKILENLEEIRNYAKFISEILKRDKGKFDKIILTNQNKNSSKKIDYRNLTSNAINNYKFSLDRNEEDEKELKEIFNDPNLIISKFIEIQDNVLKIINDNLENEIQNKKNRKEANDLIKEMKIRHNFLQNESKKLIKLYEKESKDLPITSKFCGIEDIKQVTNLIYEIYYYLCDSDENLLIKNQSMKIKDIINECNHKLKIKENKISEYIKILDIMERENPKLFFQMVNLRKFDNKEEKLMEQKKLLKKLDEEKKSKSERRFNKIIIKSRKTEAPFKSFRTINYKDENEIMNKSKKNNNSQRNLNLDYKMIIY
jgi:hypothetical protein